MAKTELDRIADAYVDTVVRLSPMTATDIGADGDHAALDYFSPAGTPPLGRGRRGRRCARSRRWRSSG